MKIVIIGGTGLLGSNLVKLYSNHEVKSFSRRKSNNIEKKYNIIIDFDKINEELEKEFDNWKPDIIINTVALINLQTCEDDYKSAYNVNCKIAIEIAKIAKKYGSYFIHVSTDHYYNDEVIFHNEDSKVNLLNSYAKTKFQAEKEIVKYTDYYLIVRTNIIGFRNKTESFFEWLLNNLKESKTINMYTNFYTSPISVNELGSILIKCYEKKIFGLYNISSREVISKYNFALKTAAIFGFESNNINKFKLDHKNNLKRALTLGLDVSKIQNALNINMPTVEETLISLKKEYDEQ